MRVRKKRNGFLDFLKFVFAIIIVIGHGDTIIGTPFPDKLIPLASFGVDFFFIISGAMLLRSVEKQRGRISLGKDTFKYMKHKIEGLLPNYYVAWILLFIVLNIGSNFKIIILNFIKSIPELLFIRMAGMPSQIYNGNTWYISAMLLSLLILYPIVRKNKEFFIKYLAPIITIFGTGYLTHNYSSILVIEQWNGFICCGIIRGISEICLGCIIYYLSQRLKKIKFTKLGKKLLTFIEFSFYSLVIFLILKYSFRHYCFVLLFIIMIPICITLSDTSHSKDIFSFKIFNWLGKYSYSLYLAQSIAYSKPIGKYIFNNGFSYSKKIIIFVIMALIFGLIVMYLSKLVSYIWGKNKNKVVSLVIVNK